MRNSGTQFRPEVVEAVTSVVEKDLRVRGARRLESALAGV